MTFTMAWTNIGAQVVVSVTILRLISHLSTIKWPMVKQYVIYVHNLHVELLMKQPPRLQQCVIGCVWHIYTHTKWKLYTVYNGIYYTWDKNTCTSQCRKWNSIMCTDIKLYQLGNKFINLKKKKQHRIFLILGHEFSYVFNIKGVN